MNTPLPRILLLVVALLMPLAASAWETVNVRGTQYVTVNSIKSFYKFRNYNRHGKTGVLTNEAVRMQVTANSQECLMNSVKFILTNPVVEHSGRLLVSSMDLHKLIDPVLRPSYINRAGNFNTVILDPGHGGKDAGARNQYGKESTYNLNVARKVRDILTAQGYKVIMTRESDRYLTLNQRVQIANRHSKHKPQSKHKHKTNTAASNANTQNANTNHSERTPNNL